MTQPSPRDPLVPLLLLLTATTGLVDAVSILGLGRVFTANMTGNVVFLAFSIAGFEGFDWRLFIAAMAFFLIGAALGGRLAKRDVPGARRTWLLLVAFVEALLLWIAAGVAVAVPSGYAAMIAIIALTATAMGLRNATIRSLKVPDLTTTVLTLTMTGLASDSPVAGGTNPNLGRRLAAVFAMLIGALTGALVLRVAGLAPPLVVAGLLVLFATALLAREKPAPAIAQN